MRGTGETRTAQQQHALKRFDITKEFRNARMQYPLLAMSGNLLHLKSRRNYSDAAFGLGAKLSRLLLIYELRSDL